MMKAHSFLLEIKNDQEEHYRERGFWKKEKRMQWKNLKGNLSPNEFEDYRTDGRQ